MKKTIAIIGGGVIGGGWLARFLLNGHDIKLFDPDPESDRKINEVLGNARHALPMLYETPLPQEGKLMVVNSLEEAVSDADYIQESVPERLDLKQQVLGEIQKYCAPSAVIASSTSGFKPSELQEGCLRPEQIMVCHPFNPVYLLPLVELVPSEATSQTHIQAAKELLTQTGFYPLHVQKEIDDAIRYGFGLRWAQMGLFETYRVAGGEAGMAHFIAQFGPALQWPWTKLMDVPILTDELVYKIADQSDAQSGAYSIRELERLRDNNLVAMIRALKQQDSAAGQLINAHEKTMRTVNALSSKMQTVARVIPIDWTDYNGHMNESRYGQVFSDAADGFLQSIGMNEAYIAAGHSYFTAETSIKYLMETHAGEAIIVDSEVLLAEGKKLKLAHQMKRADDGVLLASCEQFLLHVSLETRSSCAPVGVVAEAIDKLA